jgi:hypothetical protein
MRGHWEAGVQHLEDCLRTLSVCHERPQHCLLAVSTPEHLQGVANIMPMAHILVHIAAASSRLGLHCVLNLYGIGCINTSKTNVQPFHIESVNRSPQCIQADLNLQMSWLVRTECCV